MSEKKTETEQKNMSPQEVADAISMGKFQLISPIADGEKTYAFLEYDFNALTAMELARAMDTGRGTARRNDEMTDAQALALFAAAAAKRTEGLDATDIRERLGAADGIVAIRVANLFFRVSSLAGSLRFTKES